MSAAIGSSGLAWATSLTAALSFAVMSVGGEAHTREHSAVAGQSRAGQRELPGVLCEPGVGALCGGGHTAVYIYIYIYIGIPCFRR